MKELLEKIHNLYLTLLEKASIGYQINEIDLDDIMSLIHVVYFLKFGHPNDSEMLFIADKYETINSFLDDVDIEF